MRLVVAHMIQLWPMRHKSCPAGILRPVPVIALHSQTIATVRESGKIEIRIAQLNDTFRYVLREIKGG